MQSTYSRLTKVLGATEVEGAGGDLRFAVHAPDGAVLKVSVAGHDQRFMGVVMGPNGVVRADIDVAPVTHVTEDANFPGRITLHVGTMKIHIDTKPTLAVEIVTD